MSPTPPPLPDYETVAARPHGEHVLVVTLNRPQAGNAQKSSASTS